MSREGYAARSQKITVTCRTCGLSESFYSSISVKHFKLNHAGHDVIEELPGGQVVRQAPDAPKPGNGKAPPPVEEPVQAAQEAEVKLPRVIVELAAFPALSRPVFRIRGIKDDGSEAFVQILVFEEGTRVRDIIARGRHLDKGYTEQTFTWSPESVEYDDEVRHLLGIRAKASGMEIPSEEGSIMSDSSVRASAQELFGTAAVREASKAKDSVFPSHMGAPPLENESEQQTRPREPADRVSDWQPEPDLEPPPPRPTPVRVFPPPPQVPAPPARVTPTAPPTVVEEPEPEQATTPPAIEEAPAPVPEPVPKPEPKLEPKLEPRPEPKPEPKRQQVQAKPKSAPKPAPKEAPPVDKETEGLLVSKSWYIQGGKANKEEALRLSKVLSAFRWRVEPIYTLGVMLDDIVSIESTRNEISGTLIRSVEAAGYNLSAVTSDQGKVVAWFKRASQEAQTSQESGEQGSGGSPV